MAAKKKFPLQFMMNVKPAMVQARRQVVIPKAARPVTGQGRRE